MLSRGGVVTFNGTHFPLNIFRIIDRKNTLDALLGSHDIRVILGTGLLQVNTSRLVYVHRIHWSSYYHGDSRVRVFMCFE